MTNLAIIPARGGSKRIPRKNIRDFHGKPIIGYGITAALESNLFEDVMVSTDDAEIARIATQLGGQVPFLRSAQNSNDAATTVDVLLEVIEEYQRIGRLFDYGCCIYPTAPFLTASKLEESFRKLVSEGLDAVFPVVRFGFPVQRSLRFVDGKLQAQWPQYYPRRSQDLEPLFHDAGQFYWFSVARLVENRSLVTGNTGGIVVSENSVQDIDTEEDWLLAELKYELMIGRR